MRLTCPNCDTVYEVPAAQIPETGRHVQCSACHVRWFVRPAAEELPSEDQIIHRLESRSARPRPTVVAPPEPATDSAADTEAATAPDPSPDPEPAEASSAPMPGPAGAARGRSVPWASQPAPWEVIRADPGAPLSARPVETPPPRAEPDEPDEPDAGIPRPGRRPSRPLRLEVGDAAPEAPLPAPPRSRFGRGVLVALLAFAAALALYLMGGPLAARLPALAPAIEAYTGAVDRMREAAAPDPETR